MSIEDSIREIRSVHLYDALAELNESTEDCPFCKATGSVRPEPGYDGEEDTKFVVGCHGWKCPGNIKNSYRYDDATEAQSYWNRSY